jgi:hypothetical protein
MTDVLIGPQPDGSIYVGQGEERALIDVHGHIIEHAEHAVTSLEQQRARRAAGIAEHGIEGYWDEDFTRDAHHHHDQEEQSA